MKKIIISQRVDYIKGYKEYRDSLDHRMLHLVNNLGYLPFPIPNIFLDLKHLIIWINELKPDGIILTGGNDYKENIQRDTNEQYLINYSIKKSIPLFGICRGMQMISLSKGCKLIKVQSHLSVRHNVSGIINANVNSYHNYAIDTCPENFDVIAKSSDDEIEAIKHVKLPIAGCMWHPEREQNLKRHDLEFIKEIFK